MIELAPPPQHLLVIHSWPDGRARYADHLDHSTVDVSYVTTPAAAASVPAAAAGIEVVQRTDDLLQVANAAGRLSQRLGSPSRIIALAERDLDVAAELRVLLGCPGRTPQQLDQFRHRAALLVDESRVPAPVRVDGVWDGRRLVSWRAARQLTGLTGEAAIEVPDGPAANRLADLAAGVLADLVDTATVVHVGLTEPDRRGAAPVPNELAGWPADDDQPLLLRELHGIDLMAAELALQRGVALPAGDIAPTGMVGGWLAVPAPVPPPCVVDRIELAAGPLPPYAAVLPVAGERIAAGTRFPVRLRFRGSSAEQVAEAIRQADRSLRFRCSPA